MADKPTPIEIQEITDDLTRSQLDTRRTAADVELRNLIETGDKTVSSAKRVQELRTYVTALDESITAIEAVEFVAVDKPEPVKAAEPAEEPAPVEEPVAEPAAEPEAEPVEPDEIPAAAIAAAEAIVNEAATNMADGNGPEHVPTDEIEVLPEDGAHVGGVPIYASSGLNERDQPTDKTTISNVAGKIKGLMGVWGGLPSTEKVGLFQTNRAPQISAELWLGDDQADNTEILFGERREQSIQAAADLSICGDPVKYTVRGCELDNSTPFLDNLASNTISARTCKVEWEIPLGYDDIEPGPDFWTVCDQETVDKGDCETWKPIAKLPHACPDKCTAFPIDTVAGLEVQMNDELCRPESILRANQVIECLHAVKLEQMALTQFDNAVGASHHFPFDASVTTLGAAPSLQLALLSLTAGFGMDRKSGINPGSLVAAIHPSILATIQADMILAGEQSGRALEALTDMFRQVGISRVVVLKDFGLCEGEMCGSLPSNELICDIENCDIPGLGAGCIPFGGGAGVLPGFASGSRIRIFNPDNWVHGFDWLVDYSLRKSPEMLRQNRGEYFGERRDLLFKASPCGSFEATLDITGLCPTGQRVRSEGVVPCPIPGTEKIVGGAKKEALVVGPAKAAKDKKAVAAGDMATPAAS